MPGDAVQRWLSLVAKAQALILKLEAKGTVDLRAEASSSETEALNEFTKLIAATDWQALEAEFRSRSSLEETLQTIYDSEMSVKIESQQEGGWSIALNGTSQSGNWKHRAVVQSATEIAPWLIDRSWPYREAFQEMLRRQGLNPERYVPHDFTHHNGDNNVG